MSIGGVGRSHFNVHFIVSLELLRSGGVQHFQLEKNENEAQEGGLRTYRSIFVVYFDIPAVVF